MAHSGLDGTLATPRVPRPHRLLISSSTDITFVGRKEETVIFVRLALCLSG